MAAAKRKTRNKRPGSGNLGKYMAGVFVLGFAAVAIVIAVSVFKSFDVKKTYDYPIAMRPLKIKVVSERRMQDFTSVHAYLHLVKGADVKEACKAIPKIRDILVKALASDPPPAPDGRLDLQAVRGLMQLTIVRFLRSDNFIKNITLIGPHGGTGGTKPPKPVYFCDRDGNPLISG